MATLTLPMLGDCTTDRGVATTPEVDQLLAAGAPVAVGVSGGKDSTAVALATAAHLDRVGHTGPRLLVHADLGVVEWADSLPTCQRLAERLGWELLVVRRPQGDMMDRWEQRWADNVRRWEALSCVKLILPWSTPAMRFCTAELKVDQITRALSRRWPGRTILNVTGIRRAESTERAKAPVAKPSPKLASKTRRTAGIDWNPVIDWTTPDVFEYAAEQGFELHEAYTRFGASRVSCVWCILATVADHHAGARDPRNLELARRMVELEARSTFAFQGSRWLGETLGRVLGGDVADRLSAARAAAERRERAEARIPTHLLYTKGWPTCAPTPAEAQLIADVRAEVAAAVGLRPTFTRADQVEARYRELLAAKAAKAA